MAFITSSVYDNYWVSHPIPRSDFQYSWITASIVYEDPAGDVHSRQSPYAYSASVFGHAPPSGLVSSSVSGVVPAYNFVSASDLRSGRKSGANLFGAAANADAVGEFTHTDFVGMNINIVEPISSSENILGYPLSATGPNSSSTELYINIGDMGQLVGGATTTGGSYVTRYVNTLQYPGITSVLNGVLLHRNGPYGHPSWKQVRTGENAVARYQRKNNLLSVQDRPKMIRDDSEPRRKTLSRGLSLNDPGVKPMRSDEFRQYNFSPVTIKYKPIQMSLREVADPDGEPIRVSYTHGNNKMMYPVARLNKRLGLRENRTTLNDEIFDAYSKVDLQPGQRPEYELVTLQYTEMVYPKDVNVFLSHSRQRPTFNYKPWKEERTSRAQTDITTSMGFSVASQSAWPLDARDDFATAYSTEATEQVSRSNLTGSGNGLLQNKYTIFHSGTLLGAGSRSTKSVSFNKRGFLTASAGHSVGTLGASTNYLSNSLISFWFKSESTTYEQAIENAGSDATWAGYNISASLICRGRTEIDDDFDNTSAMGVDIRLHNGTSSTDHNTGLWANVGCVRGQGERNTEGKFGSGLPSTTTYPEIHYAANLSDDQWHHVALAWYYTSTTEHSMSLYVDGTRVASGSTGTGSAQSWNLGDLANAPTSSAILVGMNPSEEIGGSTANVLGRQGFVGFIDEISFFSGSIYGTRSGQEQWNDEVITTLYNNGNPIDVSASAPLSSSHAGLLHLLSHYKMGENVKSDTGATEGPLAGGGYATDLNNNIHDSTRLGEIHMTGNLSGTVFKPTQQGFSATGKGIVSDAPFNLAGGNSNIFGPLYARPVDEKAASGLHTGYFVGDTKWEAASQANRSPFYNSYDEYAEDLRGLSKHYTVIPEFRISEHMPYYVNTKEGNFLAKNQNWLQLTGGITNRTSSAQDGFFKTYSNSDFMKFFDIIKNDNLEEGYKDTKLKLQCNALMKFVPYEGFYPAVRTVQLVEQFSSSYSERVNFKTSASTIMAAAFGSQVNYKTFITPLFAPGVLYNSIKSGIAVDHPIMTASFTTTGTYEDALNGVSASHIINSHFGYRVPFESLIEPENYLGGVSVVDYEVHPSAAIDSTASWDGTGDELYKAAAHNFLSEVPKFFLKKQGVTSIVSAKDGGGSTYFNAKKDKEYRMRVVMYSGLTAQRRQLELQYPRDHSKGQALNTTGAFFTQPTITMYSRRSAFGPPSSASFVKYNESFEPFTPPYMDGYADVELTFRPTEDRVYFVDEIVNQMTSSYFRVGEQYFTSSTEDPGQHSGLTTAFINQMHITSSINLMNILRVRKGVYDPITGDTIRVEDDPDAGNIAIIQPKWETPILDFANVSVTLPAYGSASVSQGMWHQYGVEPAPNRGVYLQIQDIAEEEKVNPDATGSLADLMGFPKDSLKLGVSRDEKVIREAVVAIPFRIASKKKRFFQIPRRKVNRAMRVLRGAEVANPPGDSVVDMLDAMSRYVIPPKFDFINNKSVKPVVMYFFEFEHTLVKEDLINIWQNISPDIGKKVVNSSVAIEHELVRKELMRNTSSKLQWMVFKVKQKAADNYFKMLKQSVEEEGFEFSAIRRQQRTRERSPFDYTYNWPYDYFSLIELVNMEATVDIGTPTPLADSEEEPIVPPPRTPSVAPPVTSIYDFEGGIRKVGVDSATAGITQYDSSPASSVPDTSTMEARDTDAAQTGTGRSDIPSPGTGLGGAADTGLGGIGLPRGGRRGGGTGGGSY